MSSNKNSKVNLDMSLLNVADNNTPDDLSNSPCSKNDKGKIDIQMSRATLTIKILIQKLKNANDKVNTLLSQQNNMLDQINDNNDELQKLHNKIHLLENKIKELQEKIKQGTLLNKIDTFLFD